MKIINVVQDFQTGGIQKLLYDYLVYFNGNQEIDYRVVVLEDYRDGIYEQQCKKFNLKICYLNCKLSKNKHYFIRTFFNWLTYNHRLSKYLKTEKPDIVHTHNTRIFKRIYSCIKRYRKKFKWFHTLHSDPDAIATPHIPIANKMFNKYGVKPICLSKMQFEKAKLKYNIKNAFLLYNAVNLSKLTKSFLDKNTFLMQEKIPLDSFIVGCVGRVNKVKNYDFFVDVFKIIHQKKDKAIAIIAGDDSNSVALKEKIRTNNLDKSIRFLGNRKDIANIYNAIDRFVLTSFSEGFSIVALEAQSFEKYCIFSKAVPNEIICLPNKVVRLSLNDDVEVWASEIINPTRFESPTSNIKNFNIDNVATKMIMIYKGQTDYEL